MDKGICIRMNIMEQYGTYDIANIYKLWRFSLRFGKDHCQVGSLGAIRSLRWTPRGCFGRPLGNDFCRFALLKLAISLRMLL